MVSDLASRRQRRHFTGSASFKGMVRDKSFLVGLVILGLGRVWAAEAGEEGGAEEADFDVAVMLFASVLFMMMTFYLVNNSDLDIQLAAWKTISAMISIFSAVLTYSAMNGFFEELLIPEELQKNEWYQFKVHIGFAVVWYIFLQLLLAVISGAIGGEVPKAANEKEQREMAKEDGEKRELNVETFAVLCGHISGFAFIRAFAILQCWKVKDAKGFEVGAALICVLITWVSLQALFAISDKVRAKIALGDDGEEDDFEIIWDEGTEETENDVLGLTMSFLWSQVIRLLIWGKLPNEEGKYEEEGNEAARRLSAEEGGQLRQGLILIAAGAGIMMFVIAFDTFHLWPSWPNKYGKKKQEREVSWKRSEEEEEDEEGEEAEEAEWYERVKEQVMVVSAMIFAWCFFFGAQACQTSDEEHETINAVILGIVLTAIAYVLIFMVDYIRDLPGDTVDKACDEIIEALGLVVGFAWEKCFDAAVEVLVDKEEEEGYNPHLLRLGLTVAICLILVPGWRYYILPLQEVVQEKIEEKEEKEKEEKEKEKEEAEEMKSEQPSQLENSLTTPLTGNFESFDAAKQKELKALQSAANENAKMAAKIAKDVDSALQQIKQVKEKLAGR